MRQYLSKENHFEIEDDEEFEERNCDDILLHQKE